MITRRHTLAGLLAVAALPATGLHAQTGGALAFPYYSGEDALQGLYAQHLPPLARDFEAQAQALTAAARQHCASSTATSTALKDAWRRALLSWQALSSPALGPVIERRSQRQIDFWPTRPALLVKALARAPQTLADMESIGTPAKGFPAFEQLQAAKPSPAHCPYLVLLAEGIAAEATALRTGFDALAARDWTSDEDAARAAFAEWINQWLGGLERLRWAHIEQPVQKARTAGPGHAPAFARRSPADNAAEWRAQWKALLVQARLSPAQRTQPPQPGQGLIPIEALLMGKGQIALAQRWGQALDRADAAIAALPAKAGDQDLMALSKTLKGVTTLFQTEVAAALDVPLGFSDADGD
ncbi:imelysin family protein [Hydrogenophaga sp.]|uniref:imelysin family protein n=1 Tax=Hydrogenophaga sp. TaxID=1904254 RepID=UPI00286E3B00|nr:imelysin family protein [Hydrogenophaga sp.]